MSLIANPNAMYSAPAPSHGQNQIARQAQPEQPRIAREIDLCVRRIEGLRTSLGVLEDRLGPVLRPAVPAVPAPGDAGAATPVEFNSPVIDMIKSVVDRIDQIDRHVTDLTGRLDT